MNDEDGKAIEKRVAALETETALSRQSRRNLHQQYEALTDKLDSMLAKIDAFIIGCGAHRTETALLRQENITLKDELEELREANKWAFRTAISALMSAAGTMVLLLIQGIK